MAPRFALLLLRYFCPDHLFEEIEGDLLQKFQSDQIKYGTKNARKRFWLNTLRFFRPGILFRNTISFGLNQSIMVRNYMKVMARNMAKRKFYTIINVSGLTVGITFAMLIGVFIHGELQVNQNLAEVDRLFILESKYPAEPDNNIWFAPAPLARRVAEQYPTLIDSYYRFWDRQITVSHGDQHFRIQSMIGDSTFLNIFGFPVLHGNASTALTQPYSIVITEKIARQYFNKADVVGESLELTTEVNGIKEFVITAVLADLEQKNSVSDFMNMDAQIFLPLANRIDFSFSELSLTQWNSDIITYVKLSKGAQAQDAQQAFNKVLKSEAPDTVRNQRTIAFDAIQDYYLVTDNRAIQSLIITLAAIVLFVLLLAISNFINISIASSFSRLKEIGVRKVIGGIKRQVMFQFLSESIAFALLAGFLSLLLYELLHVTFGDILTSTLPSITQLKFTFWCWFVAGLLSIGILAGAYPALYLSSIQPIASLKGKLKSVQGTLLFSRGLVGMQFLIAIFIFIGAVIMSKQVSFFLDKDLGFDKSYVMVVTSVPRVWSPEGFDKMESARQEFLTSPKIKSVSLSWGSPSANFSPVGVKIRNTNQTEEQRVQTTLTCTDEAFDEVYGLRLLDGKFFTREGETRAQNSIVLNESAQKALSTHVGDKIRLLFGTEVEFTVVGIVNDFNFESLHEKVKPVAIMHNRDFQAYRYFSYKLQPGSLTESVQEVERYWKKIFPNDPFVYAFSDEKLQSLYKTEFQLKKASTLATSLMLIIVLTGVLGLVSLSVAKRNKEIGIRKVLGASSTNILALVSREYAWLMITAFVLAVPLSYIFISQWLQGFAYHIQLEWYMFLIPIAILFTITLLVVGAQSLKVALANPVKSLRTE